MQKNILFVSGIPDDDKIQVKKAHPNGDILRYVYTGLSEFFLYLEPSDWNRLPVLIDSREFPFQLDPATHCIINEIAEADSHSQTLNYLEQLLQKNPQIPVFNHPNTVKMTRRDRVYEALKDIPNLCVPQTIRFQPKHLNDVLECMTTHNMNYPLILKSAGMHGGVDTLRFDNLEQLKAGLYPMALDGRSYYLIQFHDTSQNGVFSKFRLVMIDGKVYPRHFRYAKDWMVHFGNSGRFMDENPDYHAREIHLFEHYASDLSPHLLPVLQEIYRRIPIDYTGFDLTVDANGQVVIFEMNANMLIMATTSPTPYILKSVQDVRNAVHTAVNQRIKQAP